MSLPRFSSLTIRASRRNALSVLYPTSCPIRNLPTNLTFSSQGFLPVAYTWLRTRQRTAPVFLLSDLDEDVHPSTKLEEHCEELRGWKVLLLWFPAACDLTGTTVRRSSSVLPLSLAIQFVIASSHPIVLTTFHSSVMVSTAYECRPPLHASLNLSDDTRCCRSFRGRP